MDDVVFVVVVIFEEKTKGRAFVFVRSDELSGGARRRTEN